MRINVKRIWRRRSRLLKFWPLSLARKVQVTFGAAVVLVLMLALSILYIWMGQLIKKDMFDTGRARSKVLLDRHFQLKNATQTLRPLDSAGQVRDANDSEISWFRFTEEGQADLLLLSEELQEILETLRNDPDRDEMDTAVFDEPLRWVQATFQLDQPPDALPYQNDCHEMGF